jgi:phage repressor protein C with HTH and peptisase S24 domain
MKLRIRDILTEQNKTAEWLSEALDMSPSQVSRFLTGSRRTNTDFLDAAAKALGVSVSDLFYGSEIPVVAYIGAGAEFTFVDDHQKGAGLDMVEGPPGCPPNAVAVMIRGESMYPAYYDGDILFYDTLSTDIDQFLNRQCVCRLADGRTLVKTPTRGSNAQLFTLTSFNAPPIPDVVLEWCAKIEWVKRR